MTRRSDFAQVYEEHVWRVYGFLAYRLRDRQTAEDLTQMTFERALRAWPRFDPRRASERTWLMAIATNLLIDHARRRRAEPVADPAELEVPAAPGSDEHALSAELREALQQLSERERQVLALRFGGDLGAEEIAGVMGLSVANVHQIVSRALRRLRSLMEPERPSQPAPSRAPTGPG